MDLNKEKNDNFNKNKNIDFFKYDDLNNYYFKNSTFYFKDVAYYDFEIKDLKHENLSIKITRNYVTFTYKENNYKKKYSNITCIDQILSRKLISKVKDRLFHRLDVQNLTYEKMKMEYSNNSYIYEMTFKIMEDSNIYFINKNHILMSLKKHINNMINVPLNYKDLDKLLANYFKELIYKKQRSDSKYSIEIDRVNLGKLIDYIYIDSDGMISDASFRLIKDRVEFK